MLARVLAARPDNSLVLVAGLADTDQSSRLHVAVADGPGWDGGWLTSPSTGRDGYLQLVDLAPTALAALSRPLPERLFVGQPATSVAGRPELLPDAVTFPADADREAGAQRSVATWFFGVLAAVQLLLAIIVVPLLRRARRHVGDERGRPQPISATVEVLLLASALAMPAALLADVVPWWRGGQPGWLFAAVLAFVLAAGTAAVRLAPVYRHTLGPLGHGGHGRRRSWSAWTCSPAPGCSSTAWSATRRWRAAGTRAGHGRAGRVHRRCPARRRRAGPAVRPSRGGRRGGRGRRARRGRGRQPVPGRRPGRRGGADRRGVHRRGAEHRRLADPRPAGLGVGGRRRGDRRVRLVDLRRPAAERGSLGRFVEALGDGTGGTTLHRASKANLDALAGSPLTLLALVGAALVWLALLHDWGGLRRLFGIYPAVRAGAVGIGVAVVLGGVLGGAALDLAGAAAAVAVPMAALAALRVLDHASDFTRPAEPAPAGRRGGCRRGMTATTCYRGIPWIA